MKKRKKRKRKKRRLRFFFVHVMKTGGTSFVKQVDATFPPGARYPFLVGPERRSQYTKIKELRRLSPESRRSVQIYCGHFPYFATTIVGPVTTMTLLRDPIERTVSILRHFRRGLEIFEDIPLEQIYEHPLVFSLFIHNYQAKMFAMTHRDMPESHIDAVEVDESHLHSAKENLERVDVLGLSHRHDEFLDELCRRFGWRLVRIARERVSTEGWDVPQSFRQRIAADNQVDVEFYEHALTLYDRRRS